MRSATESASSWSCVTMIVVTPSSRCSWRISWRRRTRSSASSAESGSSSSSSPGEVASARASAMRCCCPPESCDGNFGAAAGQADELEQLVDARRDPRLLDLAVDQPVGDVVADGQVRKERVRLEDDAVVALGRRQHRDVALALADPARGLRLEPGDDAQQRRLAAARRAEEADELAALDREVDVRERLERSEGLADALEAEVLGHRPAGSGSKRPPGHPDGRRRTLGTPRPRGARRSDHFFGSDFAL